MKYSIIIPVRTINNSLKENVLHLKKLNFADFEVLILVDEAEVYDFADTRFKTFEVGALSPGEKRNIGATKATGEILAFLDDDAFPSETWLNYANEVFSNNSVYALGAPAVTPQNVGLSEKCSGLVLESYLTSAGTVYRHKPQAHRLVDDYPTVNLFIKKRHFEEAGGFIKEFWPGEDTKLCLDLVQKFGVSGFVYDPRPIVYHHRRNLFKPHLRQISRYGQHRGQFARIFPQTSRRPSYFIPSFFVLGLLFGWIIPDIYLFVVFMYLTLVVLESAKIFIKGKNLHEAVYVGLGIVFTHLVYGINFIIGFMKRPKLQLRKVDKTTGNYLGG